MMDDELIPHDPRTRAEKQLDCLRDLLAQPNWSGEETYEILAGIDPQLSFGRTNNSWWLLPGTPSNIHTYEMEDRFIRLERIAALRQTIRPADAIRIAMGAGCVPPWLEVAKGDPECRPWLPPELFDEAPLTIKEVAARGGRATAQKGEKAKLRQASEPVILAMLKENPNVMGSKIIAALEDKFGHDRIKPSTVYERWLPKLRAAVAAPKDSGS